MHIENRPIDTVKPYPRNARKIPEKAVAKVATSLAEFGWKQPLVVDAQGFIIVGHTRLLAAKKLGYGEVPVLVGVGPVAGEGAGVPAHGQPVAR